MRVYIAADHAGFHLKERLKPFLMSCGYEVYDTGNYIYDPQDDYPEFIRSAAFGVVDTTKQGHDVRGIVIGGSGQGEAIAANRVPGIRAVVYYGNGIRVDDGKIYDIITLSREHNDANVLSIGARFVDSDKIFLAVKQWLELPFSNDERHIRRIRQLDE